MLTFLSGGTGTPKLLAGMKEVERDFAVVVNTAEDVWVSGNKICPDIDSVIYALAGIIDDAKWWGVKNDTFHTHNRLKELGIDEGMMIGDADRATHVFRSELLRKGFSLKEATEMLARAMGVEQKILPMCEEEVATQVVTPEGKMHFQEFWVKRRGEPEVAGIEVEGIDRARPAEEVLETIAESRAVIIGPSNPVTSIGPILMIDGIRRALEGKKVIAVSPVIGKNPVSGPAGKFMKALGYDVSPEGVLDFYRGLIDVFVVQQGDGFESDSTEVVETNTIMKTAEDAVNLAKFILNLL
ncbi:2-phospho-L-lactate transferase [Geoglobus acetivorans]|uniref:2-phospho-L-lactate transferase n=1 Tax=Geoglobus acetivorans TaxID=565033 RepID=A0A0A7GDW5_GEOAI|nr:2-phospho-L-lactate transferase [Geoglobus acetivorans]